MSLIQRTTRGPHNRTLVVLSLLGAALFGATQTDAQTGGTPTPLRKIGEMELSLLGVSATVDPLNPVVPKNIASGVRIVVSAGGQQLTLGDVARFLGAGFEVQAELSGPGFAGVVSLPV